MEKMESFGQVLLNPDGIEALKDQEPEADKILEKLILSFDAKRENEEKDILRFLLAEDIHNADLLQRSIQMLIQKSLADRTFARIAIELVIHLQSICGSGETTVRDTFLKLLQLTHETCHRNKSANIREWLGCVGLIVHAMVNMKINGVPLKPLLVKSQECLISCMQPTATNEEIECAAELLMVSCNIMCSTNKEVFKDLMNSTCNVIIKARGSDDARKLLIEVVERVNSSWSGQSVGSAEQ